MQSSPVKRSRRFLALGLIYAMATWKMVELMMTGGIVVRMFDAEGSVQRVEKDETHVAVALSGTDTARITRTSGTSATPSPTAGDTTTTTTNTSTTTGTTTTNTSTTSTTIRNSAVTSAPLAVKPVSPEEPFYSYNECFIPGFGVREYRYPKKTFIQENRTFIVGVLSTSFRPQDRIAVRRTWAYGHSNVFFLVSGNWTPALEQEFKVHNDLFYLNSAEAYRMVTAKVLAFLSAVHRHMPQTAVLKTDDDSYIRMRSIADIEEMKAPGLHYIGEKFVHDDDSVMRSPKHKWHVSYELYPHETYPPYAYGGGYILSAEAVECAVQQINQRNDTEVFPVEDAFVGILMSGCPNVQMHEQDNFYTESKARNADHPKTRDDIKTTVILHQVWDPIQMRELHQEVCCPTSGNPFPMDPISCMGFQCPRREDGEVKSAATNDTQSPWILPQNDAPIDLPQSSHRRVSLSQTREPSSNERSNPSEILNLTRGLGL